MNGWMEVGWVRVSIAHHCTHYVLARMLKSEHLCPSLPGPVVGEMLSAAR